MRKAIAVVMNLLEPNDLICDRYKVEYFVGRGSL